MLRYLTRDTCCIYLYVKMYDLKIVALDHVALASIDVERSLAFYHGQLGLDVERLDAFRTGAVPFPSLRINDSTSVDLMPRTYGGVDHLALCVDGSTSDVERALAAKGIDIVRRQERNFGARGLATSWYVRDPQGALIELRTYR